MTAPVDVLAVMAESEEMLRQYSHWEHDDEVTNLADRLNSATNDVRDLIEQRDALVGVLFGLTQTLPKGSRSLSSGAQAYLRDGATLACAIFDRTVIDPEAFNRYSRSLWGSQHRMDSDDLKSRYAAAFARIRGAALARVGGVK